jgi:uncharacterized membrane protein
MIQVHVFDSFLQENLHETEPYRLSQLLGGLAAPLFLFMAGISLALVCDRMREQGASTAQLIKRALRRGAWILLLAYAFRIEQVVTWYPYANWADIWKVDILNCIAVSSLLAGVCAAFVESAAVMSLAAAAIVLTTPIVASVNSGLPAILLAYLNGNGRGDYFTIFPWAGYTFAGAAAGYALLTARKQEREYAFMLRCAGIGALLYLLGYEVNRHPGLMLGLASYTRTSPHYFFSKLGYLLILVYGAYRWSIRAHAQRWSPVIIFGQTSLLIYWVHIEFVYGRLRMFKNTLGVGLTVAQLLWLVPLMLALAAGRLSYRERTRAKARDYIHTPTFRPSM